MDKTSSLINYTSTPYTAPGAQPTMQTLCQCGEVMAGLGTTTVGNQVLAGCELSTWSIVSTISTIAPPPVTTTAPPPPQQTCHLHILEGSEAFNNPLYVQLNVTAGANAPVISKYFKLNWGQSASVLGSDTGLSYDITADFLQTSSVSKAKRVKRLALVGPPPPPPNYEAWAISFTAGSTKWNDKDTDKTKMPYCNVGGWDNGNFWDFLDALTSLGADEYMPVSLFSFRLCFFLVDTADNILHMLTFKNRTAKWTAFGFVSDTKITL